MFDIRDESCGYMNKETKNVPAASEQELEWLAQYYYEHGRRDIALEILAQLKNLKRFYKSAEQESISCKHNSGQHRRRSC